MENDKIELLKLGTAQLMNTANTFKEAGFHETALAMMHLAQESVTLIEDITGNDKWDPRKLIDADYDKVLADIIMA